MAEIELIGWWFYGSVCAVWECCVRVCVRVCVLKCWRINIVIFSFILSTRRETCIKHSFTFVKLECPHRKGASFFAASPPSPSRPLYSFVEQKRGNYNESLLVDMYASHHHRCYHGSSYYHGNYAESLSMFAIEVLEYYCQCVHGWLCTLLV